MIRNRMLAMLAAVGLFFAVGLAISAAASDEEKKTPAKTSAAPQTPSQGVRVFIDPATGKQREPEPEERQQLTPGAPGAARRAAQPAVLLQGPKGAVGMQLDDSQMVYSVATMKADGTVSFECVKGSADAAKAVGKPIERRQPDVK